MEIAITSSSQYNFYISTLIYKLMKQGDKPRCVICAEKSKIAMLFTSMRKSGCAATIKRFLSFYRITNPESKDNNARHYLREYALSNDIANWNLSLRELCRREGIDYLRVRNVNSKEALKYIKKRNIDILIYGGGGGILRKPLIDAVKVGILNAHIGWLPAYRGTDCLEWGLFYGDKIGTTIHFIDEGVDTGDILLFKEIAIDKGDKISNLHAKSDVVNIDSVTEYARLLKLNRMKGIKQSHKDGRQYFVMHPRLVSVVEQRLEGHGF